VTGVPGTSKELPRGLQLSRRATESQREAEVTADIVNGTVAKTNRPEDDHPWLTPKFIALHFNFDFMGSKADELSLLMS
jgi:hypothetical protein